MSRRTVLIVSSQEDTHSIAVSKVLKERFNHDSEILDMSGYPAGGSLTATLAPDSMITGNLSHPRDLALDDIVSVWWRRPQPFQPADSVDDPRLRQFVVQECRTTFEGMLLARQVRFVNDRAAEYIANHKLCQLETARRVGFRVPRTIITNDPEAVLAFKNEQDGEIVFKAQTDARYHMGETRLLKPEHLDKISLVSLAPVIFQEYIPGQYDVRLTIAGRRQFAIRIHTNSGRSPVDWRLDPLTPMESVDLSAEVSAMATELMRQLRLDFGAMDLRVMPSGEVVFFEVNPAGQFLFCELSGQLQITEAVAHLLITPAA